MAANSKPELATVISHFLPVLNTKHKLPPYKLRVLDAIQKCRTEYMGGHVEACQDCGNIHEAFNSCRNRHCPKCGAIEKERWVLNREADLLPVKYFHVVFTVPDKLNKLFLDNQQAMYNQLFYAVWDVMDSFGQTPKWLGGKIGYTALLHTSGQNLHYHPHLHLIVPAGALMPDGSWKHARNRGKFLFDVKQLSSVFSARFVEQIRKMKKEGAITGEIPTGLFDKKWAVYAKQPFGSPNQIINYLGRYTHRTAISNERILHVDGKTVTFSWKDYRHNYKQQVTTLKGECFLDLFCQHILPPGFTRIRHYGFLSSASKTKSLPKIRIAIKAKPILKPRQPLSWQDIIFAKTGIKPGICKCCGGKMVAIKSLPNHFLAPKRAPPLLNLP